MVPSLPKVGYSTIEGGGEGSTDGISLSPVSSSTAGVRQPYGSLPVEYAATHPSTMPPDLTRIVVQSLEIRRLSRVFSCPYPSPRPMLEGLRKQSPIHKSSFLSAAIPITNSPLSNSPLKLT